MASAAAFVTDGLKNSNGFTAVFSMKFPSVSTSAANFLIPTPSMPALLVAWSRFLFICTTSEAFLNSSVSSGTACAFFSNTVPSGMYLPIASSRDSPKYLLAHWNSNALASFANSPESALASRSSLASMLYTSALSRSKAFASLSSIPIRCAA